jgi:hypothetical protein
MCGVLCWAAVSTTSIGLLSHGDEGSLGRQHYPDGALEICCALQKVHLCSWLLLLPTGKLLLLAVTQGVLLQLAG